jgi:hypothetical protein
MILLIIIILICSYHLFKEYERLNAHIIALWEEIASIKKEITLLKEFLRLYNNE